MPPLPAGEDKTKEAKHNTKPSPVDHDLIVIATLSLWGKGEGARGCGSYKYQLLPWSSRSVRGGMVPSSRRSWSALNIQTRVDVLQRTFQEQVNSLNDPEVLLRFQNINNVVASTTLRGSYVEKKETYIEPDATYRSFVLVRLNGADIDKNYLDSMRQIQLLETRLRSSEAWKELERRADQLRLEDGTIPPLTDRELQGNN